MGLDLTSYKTLSFDVYGTLIDWESGIAAALRPWAAELGLDADDETLLTAYADSEAAVELERSTALYPDVLGDAFRRTGAVLGQPVSDEWAGRLSGSVPDWPAFPDSAQGLDDLAGYYRLIVLSNVDRRSFEGSRRRLGGDFAAIITAEDVGAYKPAGNHFKELEATLARLGVPRGQHLHVAQSLFHDHVPAKRHGLDSVWINRRHARRGWGATPQPDEEFGYLKEFTSIEEFAIEATAQFAGH